MTSTRALFISLIITVAASAQITLQEVRTAADNVVVAFFMSPNLSDLKADSAGIRSMAWSKVSLYDKN
jgi:uncharacterized protein YcnI